MKVVVFLLIIVIAFFCILFRNKKNTNKIGSNAAKDDTFLSPRFSKPIFLDTKENFCFEPINDGLFEYQGISQSTLRYPLLKVPRYGEDIIFEVSHNKKGKIGYSENLFKKSLYKVLSKVWEIQDGSIHVFDDLCISFGGQMVEPDIALKVKFKNQVLWLDIEVDEFYCLHDQIPIHYRLDDTITIDHNRDELFINHGWIVIRFTEKQVIENSISCSRFIIDTISSIYSRNSNEVFLSDEKIRIRLKLSDIPITKYFENIKYCNTWSIDDSIYLISTFERERLLWNNGVFVNNFKLFLAEYDINVTEFIPLVDTCYNNYSGPAIYHNRLDYLFFSSDRHFSGKNNINCFSLHKTDIINNSLIQTLDYIKQNPGHCYIWRDDQDYWFISFYKRKKNG